MKERKLFGTNGVRGIANKDMNIDLATRLGQAIGTFFHGTVIIGTDPRTSSDMLRCAVISGLLATGCDVIYGGIAPSPAIQFKVKTSKAEGGVIITASHNPPEFNGIKCIDNDGTELARAKEIEIERRYFGGRFKEVSWSSMGKLYRKEVIEDYLNAILSKVDRELIADHEFKLVLDCGNGATCKVAPQLAERLGCDFTMLNATYNGKFPGRAPEPLPDEVGELTQKVKDTHADLGAAFDGDGDRVIFVDDRGRYVYGDKSLALMAREVISKEGGLMVTPVSSSSVVEEMVKPYGEVKYTKVGAPIVAREMMAQKATFGGEENGGLIFAEHQYCRDGPMGLAKMLELLAKSNKKISALIDELPSYSLYKTKVRCDEKFKEKLMQKFIEAQKEVKMLTIDGAKLFYPTGWVLVRPSGTEPIIRIFSEAKEEEKAKRLGEENKRVVREILARLK